MVEIYFIEDARAILKAKELKKRVFGSKEESSCATLMPRGRLRKKNNDKKYLSKFKSKFKRNNKCFNCNKEMHHVKNCPYHKSK